MTIDYDSASRPPRAIEELIELRGSGALLHALVEFFDAPLRTYSAGMIVRLAFAVATSVDADILLIDEALAVGDAEFQARCAERMAAYRAMVNG